ncbi:MAG: 2-oxoacid:acceptor oxidoreductase family protein [Thermodesulfobacteriota bacterium]
MQEVIFYGRGGQGAVTAVELAAQAAIAEDKYAQGFPSFGPERRGAPVMAFLRVSDEPVFSREKINSPDCVVVMDPTLLRLIDTTRGLKDGGTIIVNSSKKEDDILQSLQSNYRVVQVNATKIAMETLGVPITNTAILGALINAMGIVKIESIEQPLDNRFGKLAIKNLTAMKKACEEAVIYQFHSTLQDNQKTNQKNVQSKGINIEALYPWKDVVIGCDITTPGSSARFNTGNWRTTGMPYTDFDKCSKCGICWIMCPDMAYDKNSEGYYDWNSQYCKGCGICAEECPTSAIEMREE